MEPTADPPPEIENGRRNEQDEQQRCNKKAKVVDEIENTESMKLKRVAEIVDEIENSESMELKLAAEIVLVLSTMATIRGGKKPSDVEVELMREARSKLAVLCLRIAPKDIVAGEAIGSVIQDIGLNVKGEDQRLGFRTTPKMSIAERYSFAKTKMEESKKFSAPSTTYTSQPLQTNTSGMVDNRVPNNAVRMFASDKSNHTAISSTASMVSIPPHLTVGSSAALQYQSTSNEVRPPIVSGVMPNNHIGRNPSSVALPRVENPQFKVTGGLSGAPYVLQVQANSVANQSLANAPTWSIQTQPVSLARNVSENKAPPAHNSVKGEGTAGATTISRAGPQVTTTQSIRPFITQMGPGNMSSMHQPLQGGNMVQPPMIPSHSDIAKVVQKLLLPKVPDHPTWTPPSRDYMSKTFTCQTCELPVNEVDSVLMCDACEKGFHLKCLQPAVIRGIHNRVDWHCMRCLSLSGGKPLPPKYVRVMRSSITSPSFPSNTAGIQSSSEKKAESLDSKGSPQMFTSNGNSVPTVCSANHNTEPSFDSNTPDMRDIQGSNFSSSIETIDEKPDPSICMKSAVCSANTGLQGESYAEQIDSKALTSKDTSESETLPKLSEPAKCENLQPAQNSQAGITVSHDNAEISSDRHVSSSLTISNQKESHGGENITSDINHNDLDVPQPNSVGVSGTNTEGIQHSALSSDSSHAVEWIGDVVQLLDEKKYYQSCCIDGVTYRLQGHAFFTSHHGKLTPSKLQSLWEDSKTGVKWVKATKCYFPDDLPGNIGHPCISEVNEVYESNSDRIEMASSIRGPCVVLPYDKFKQENDRRCQFGIEASASVQPIFLCRWFYDEIKKSFQPVIS
ncbi:RING/FYVE/PHD zinc finger superfamily protein [Trifolium repens]|nr:RING/FYVE/PHD zinc finger superfamily protein [Trifolium repens]